MHNPPSDVPEAVRPRPIGCRTASVLVVSLAFFWGSLAAASPSRLPRGEADVLPIGSHAGTLEWPQANPQKPDLPALQRTFERAVSLFGSPQQPEAEPLFSEIIDALQPAAGTLNPDVKRLLVDSLGYRAQIRFNNGDSTLAAADLKVLVSLDPAFAFGQGTASRQLVVLLEETRQRNTGTLVVSVTPADATLRIDGRETNPGDREFRLVVGLHTLSVSRPPQFESRDLPVEIKPGETTNARVALVAVSDEARGRIRLRIVPGDAGVLVDGARLPAGVVEVPVRPGNHTIVVEAVAGYKGASRRVRVDAGQLVEVEINLEPARDQPPPPFAAPRRVLFKAGLAYQPYAVPNDLSTPFRVYGKVASLTSTYTLERSKAAEGQGREFGAMVRLWKSLAIGVTRTAVNVTHSAILQGEIPSAGGTYARTLEGTVTGLDRTEEAWHVQIATMGSGKSFVGALFAGPSWVRVTQRTVVSAMFRDYGSYVEFSGVDTSLLTAKSRVGVNVGFDLTWLIKGYVGFGTTVRFSWAEVPFGEPVESDKPAYSGRLEMIWGLRARF